MSAIDATELLRSGLLNGLSVLLAGGPPAPLDSAVASALIGLGARVSGCVSDAEDETSADRAVAVATEASADIAMLVVDGAGLFAHGLSRPGGERRALRACLDATWNITRAVVNHAFLPADGGASTRRIVYLTPHPAAGPGAAAARAGLENLARTLSVEWARHAINVIAIAPGTATTAEEAAALTAYLASPAGAYFSGCILALGS
jgi:NAD(P)-dependent dehydrogenase (short-subunit alcohol dehydrogenase family)